MTNTKIEYVVQVLHNSLSRLMMLFLFNCYYYQKRKLCLSILSDHHLFFSDTFSLRFKVRNCDCLRTIYIRSCARMLMCIYVHYVNSFWLNMNICRPREYSYAHMLRWSDVYVLSNWTSHRLSICIMFEMRDYWSCRWRKAEIWFTDTRLLLSRSMCTS